MRAISACCLSIARPSAISRAAASRRHCAQVPGKKRPRPASSSRTAVPTVSRNQRSWATMTIAVSSVSRVCSSHSSDSMSRWFVGSSSSSRSGCDPSARASDARVSWPPENVESWRSRSLVGEAEAAHHAGGAVAPVPAAGVLEARLRARVRVHRPSRRRRPSACASSDEVLLERDELRRAGEDVVAQGQVALARRALIVQRDAAALLEGELARRRPTSGPRACAGASSCPPRCARRWSAGRGARA